MRRRPQGFTLIELLITIGIAFVLMSIGVGMYMSIRRSTQLYGEASKIAAVISSAHNSAISQHAPALVSFTVIRPQGSANPGDAEVIFYAVVRQPVAAWHFEAPDAQGNFEGSRGYKAYPMNDARIWREGRVGSALYLPPPQEPGKGAYLTVGTAPNYVPALDLRDGIHIEAWINPSADGLLDKAIMPIVSKWDDAKAFSAYTLYLEYDAGVNAFALVGSIHTPSTIGSQPMRVQSRCCIPPGAWTHVAMSFRPVAVGGRKLTYAIDGEEDVDNPVSTLDLIALSSGPVRIGWVGPSDQPSSYVGLIDEVSISTFASGERQKLSPQVVMSIVNVPPVDDLVGSRPCQTYRIEYDRTGRLKLGSVPQILLFPMATGNRRMVREIDLTLLGGVEMHEWEQKLANGQWTPLARLQE